VWISRAVAIMGNVDEPVYDWRFDTLGEMADVVLRGLVVVKLALRGVQDLIRFDSQLLLHSWATWMSPCMTGDLTLLGKWRM
jgi:hypothetical protein